MVEESLIIYGKENCPHTRRAREAHPGHIFMDVQSSLTAMQNMLELSGGVRRVPVLAQRTDKGEQLISVGYNKGS
jgi:glutaredoxin